MTARGAPVSSFQILISRARQSLLNSLFQSHLNRIDRKTRFPPTGNSIASFHFISFEEDERERIKWLCHWTHRNFFSFFNFNLIATVDDFSRVSDTDATVWRWIGSLCGKQQQRRRRWLREWSGKWATDHHHTVDHHYDDDHFAIRFGTGLWLGWPHLQFALWVTASKVRGSSGSRPIPRILSRWVTHKLSH